MTGNATGPVPMEKSGAGEGNGKIGRAFLIIAAILTVYSALFIYRTTFVIDGTRYFCLFDDEMICMRYARNLADGAGLVWNAGGEKVEGFTNPLWTLAMAAFHLLPLPDSKMSICVQILGLVFLLGTVYFTGRAALIVGRGSTLLAVSAMVMLAGYYPFVNWCLQGTEVSALAMAITAALWLSLSDRERGTRSVWPYVILGAATWLRPDAVVPYAVVWACLFVVDRTNRRFHLACGSAAIFIALALQTGIRYFYYGDILPNTYYLKLTGFPLVERIARGASVLGNFLPWPLFFILLVGMSWSVIRRNGINLLPLFLFGTQLVYSVYVGGDAWEWWGGTNRYMAITAPALFIWLVCFLRFSLLAGWRNLDGRKRGIFIFAIGLFIGIFNLPLKSGMFAAWSLEALPPSAIDNYGQMLMATRINQVTALDARIAVIWAGTVPYFTRRPAIDILGKCDREIAKQPAFPGLEFFPGHNKWNYYRSFGLLDPDVITQMWHRPELARPFLAGRFQVVRLLTVYPLGSIDVYLRLDSPRVKWDFLKQQGYVRQAPGGSR